MEDQLRLRYAIERVADNSVFIVERADWERMILNDGRPTRLEAVAPQLSGLVSMAAHVMSAGSGILNASPGIDVVRYDSDDDPCIFNVDHYNAFENFPTSPLYLEALSVAGVQATEDLNKYIASHVFVVGPYQTDNHWVRQIPDHIREAARKP